MIRGLLGLVSKGVPWEIADRLSVAEQDAIMCVIGELTTGEKFDWASGKWHKRSGQGD